MLKAMLTSKQTKFIESYLANGSAKESAINAGYPEKSAACIGWQLLKNQKVLADLDSKRTQLRLKVTKESYVDKALETFEKLDIREPNSPRFYEIAGKSLGYIGNTQPIGASNDNRQVNITMLNLSDEQKKAPALIDMARSLMSAS